MTSPRKSRDPRTLRPATRLVHGGAMRSQFDETSEALFLTQGYLYDTMAEAEARFKGDAPGFIYSRFANPTVAHVRAAHGAVRGRRGGARHRQRHGGGDRGADGPAQGRRPYRRVAGAVRLVSLRRRRAAAAFRRRLDLGRGNRPRRLEGGDPPQHQDRLPRKPDQSDAGGDRHRRRRRHPAQGRRDAGGRQRLRLADAAASARARRRLRRLFGDQAHRRPGPHVRGHHPRLARRSSPTTSTISSARPAPACRRSTPGCC